MMTQERGDTMSIANPTYIDVDAVYSLDEFSRRMDLGGVAIRKANAQGLPVHQIGRRKYVIGREVVNWLKTRGNVTDRRQEAGAE
jgi:hypothetical protein